MIDVNESLRGLWYMEVEDGKSDWMGGLHELPTGNTFTWRMRYYTSDATEFENDKDRKSWHRQASKPGESIEQSLMAVRVVANIMSNHATGKLYEHLRGSKSLSEFMQEWAAMPFVHVKHSRYGVLKP